MVNEEREARFAKYKRQLELMDELLQDFPEESITYDMLNNVRHEIHCHIIHLNRQNLEESLKEQQPAERQDSI